MTPALAKVLLHTHKWQISDIIARHQRDADKLLKESRIAPQIDLKVIMRDAHRRVMKLSEVWDEILAVMGKLEQKCSCFFE